MESNNGISISEVYTHFFFPHVYDNQAMSKLKSKE